MPSFAGSALRLTVILGIYSYFLAVLADRDIGINPSQKAVEGISGIAVVYTIFAVLLTCFLGGVRFFAFLGIVLDFLFVGGFIALAVLTRDGASSCTGFVHTPFGYGPVVPNQSGPGYGSTTGNQYTYQVGNGLACRLNKACFAVSIIGAFLFLISMFLQLWIARHHQKEKKYGPSPANNYTSGSGRRKFWKRGNKTAATKDAELGAINGHNEYRPSHDTGYTGTTVTGANTSSVGHTAQPGFHTGPTGTAVDHGGYTTAPQGTAVSNPYGYGATRGTASNF